MRDALEREIKERRAVIAAAHTSQDRYTESDQLFRLGEIYDRYEYGQEAIDCYQQALVIAHKIGDRSLEVGGLMSLAQTYTWMGQPQSAIDCLEQVRLMARHRKQPEMEIHTLHKLGHICEHQGDYKSALNYAEISLKIYEAKFPDRVEFIQKRIADLRQRLNPDDNI